MYFTLWTHNHAITVEMGPWDFVKRSGFRLRLGEMVTVLGMPVPDANGETVLAREITKGDSVFIVRDRNGQPAWEKGRKIEMDPDMGKGCMTVC
jgi:hypothetical protein